MIDTVVVGAGAGGLATCYGLARRGFKVLCVEQGGIIEEAEIIPMAMGGEIQKFGALSSSPKTRNDKWGYPINTEHSPIEIHNYCGIGGSTLLFSAQYPRLNEEDFAPVGSGKERRQWPVRLEDLYKYYIQNEDIVGLSGLHGDPNNPEVYPVNGPVPLGKMGRKLVEGFEKLGIHWWPAYAALEYSQYNSIEDLRPTNIDISGRKGSAKSAYYQKCLDLGVIFLVEHCARRIITDFNDERLVRGIETVSSKGETGLIEAKHIVLSAGGIGTPRIMLNSKSSGWPLGIGNNDDLVGRGLMLHPWGYVEGLFKECLDSVMGPQGCCLISQHHYKYSRSAAVEGGFTLQALRGPWPYESARTWYLRKKLHISNDMYINFQNLFNHTAHLAVITDDDPISGNRVLLDSSESDRYGCPGVKVEYNISPKTRGKLCSGLDIARNVMKASGSIKTWAWGPVRETGWHNLGTCPMGDNKKLSVVDKQGRVHGMKNLYVADGSIFSRGGSVNPANTIQALGLYIAERIRHE